MRPIYRKTAPKVRGGKVQRKNRWSPTPTCENTPQPRPLVHRRKPGTGYRHLLRRSDIERFMGLLPDWPELSRGLNAIVLAPGDPSTCGWHRPGVVAICAWQRDLNLADLCPLWLKSHGSLLLKQISEPGDRSDDDRIVRRLAEWTIRAFQLTHILLHELGHHHDRMTTRRQLESCRGENYAEEYCMRHSARIWDVFLDEFVAP